MPTKKIRSLRAADDVRVREHDALRRPRASGGEAKESRLVRRGLVEFRRARSRHQLADVDGANLFSTHDRGWQANRVGQFRIADYQRSIEQLPHVAELLKTASLSRECWRYLGNCRPDSREQAAPKGGQHFTAAIEQQ